MDALVECARDVVLAVFRLAVTDYLGLSYGHDGPDRRRRVERQFVADAALFLASAWADHLAASAGFSASAVWREAHARGRAQTSSRPALRANEEARAA